MADETIVKGLSDLAKFMDELPIKVERNIARGALRAGMKLVKTDAQQRIHSKSGQLAAGLKIFSRVRRGLVIVSLRATGKHAFAAHMLEFGTKRHTITAKNRKGLSFGGLFFQSVEHPGSRPFPFMRPALDSQANAAVVAAAEFMKTRLADKHGLDTSSVLIAGDE
jgi:HK97 gp10 family phage protein